MIIDDLSFHDTYILEVKEISSEQTMEFLIDFPTDWENNFYEKKILKFTGVITYQIEDLPFHGPPTILDIVNLGKFTKSFGTGRNQIDTEVTKIEMQLNAGNRMIEFANCELLTQETKVRNDLIAVKAKIYLRKPEEGGRFTGIRSGYRPNHVFEPFTDINQIRAYNGIIQFDDTELFHVGETKIVIVKFLHIPEIEKYMHVGRKWLIYEVPILVAEGEIIEI